MCKTCWEEGGSPRIETSAVIAAAKAIDHVYDHEGAGGALHIVVDDYNIKAFHVEHCSRWLEEHREDFSPESARVQEVCLAAVRVLGEEELLSAVALASGDWSIEGLALGSIEEAPCWA